MSYSCVFTGLPDISRSSWIFSSQDPNVGISDIPPPSLSPFSSPLSSFSLSQPTPSNARSTRLTPTTDSLGILPVTIIGSMVPSSATPLQSSPTTPNMYVDKVAREHEDADDRKVAASLHQPQV